MYRAYVYDIPMHIYTYIYIYIYICVDSSLRVVSATVPQGTQWSGCQSQFRSASRWCAGPGFAGLRSAFCRSSIGDPPPISCIACVALRGFFRTFFSCFFRTPSWKPFGPPKLSIIANLDPKMTPKWSPKSKKNQTSRKSEN